MATPRLLSAIQHRFSQQYNSIHSVTLQQHCVVRASFGARCCVVRSRLTSACPCCLCLQDPNIIRNGRMDMLSLKEYR